MVREDQADEIIGLLRDLLDGVREMNTNFDEFTGHNVYKMSTAIDVLGDRITGGAGGIGGDSLSDVSHRIEMVELALPTE